MVSSERHQARNVDSRLDISVRIYGNTLVPFEGVTVANFGEVDDDIYEISIRF